MCLLLFVDRDRAFFLACLSHSTTTATTAHHTRLARTVVFVGRLVAVVQLAAGSRRLRRLMLHPRFGRIQVQSPVLDVLVDFLGRLQEGVLHILAAARSHPNGR